MCQLKLYFSVQYCVAHKWLYVYKTRETTNHISCPEPILRDGAYLSMRYGDNGHHREKGYTFSCGSYGNSLIAVAMTELSACLWQDHYTESCIVGHSNWSSGFWSTTPAHQITTGHCKQSHYRYYARTVIPFASLTKQTCIIKVLAIQLVSYWQILSAGCRHCRLSIQKL